MSQLITIRFELKYYIMKKHLSYYHSFLYCINYQKDKYDRYFSYFLHEKRVSIIPIQLYFSVVSGENTHIKPQGCLFYRMVIRICRLNNPLGTVIFL